MKYCTKEQVLDYLLLEVEADFEDTIDSWIEMSSEEINTYTNRVFEADTTATERKYDGNNLTKLYIDDFVELTSVEVDDTDITDDVLVYPANTLPKNLLYYENAFTMDKQNVDVTAKWGYSVSAPDDIVFACIVITAGKILFAQRTTEIKSEKIGNYQVTYEEGKRADVEMVKHILNKYKRYDF